MNEGPGEGPDRDPERPRPRPHREQPPCRAGCVHGPSPGGAKCVSLTAPRAVYASEQPDFRGFRVRLASLRIELALLIPDSGTPEWDSGVHRFPAVDSGIPGWDSGVHRFPVPDSGIPECNRGTPEWDSGVHRLPVGAHAHRSGSSSRMQIVVSPSWPAAGREGAASDRGERAARAELRGTGARPRPTVRRDDRPGGPTSPAVEPAPATREVSR